MTTCPPWPPPLRHTQGALLLRLELLFPAHLSQAQKVLLRAAFRLPHRPDEAQTKALRAFEAAFTDAAHGWSGGVIKGSGGGVAAQE